MNFINQTNIISIVILIVIYFSFKKQSRTMHYGNRYFFALLWLNVTVLSIDIIVSLLNGSQSIIGRFALTVSFSMYFITSLAILIMWLFYIDYYINKRLKNFKNILLMFGPILLVYLILLVLSFDNGHFFIIDSEGYFHRGDMLIPIIVFSLGIFVFSMFYIILNKKLLTKSDLNTLLSFPAPMFLAAIMQIFVPGVQLVWPSMTLSILILYIYIQSKITNTDVLTGVFNRREYEYQLYNIENNLNMKKTIGAIMIDIDNFKAINDEISHQEGDNALIELGRILTKSVRKNDFIARIGGDEFCVILEIEKDDKLFEIIQRIEQNLAEYNKKNNNKSKLSISMGYGIYDEKHYLSFKKFFYSLDRKMYEDKKLTKIKCID